MKIKAIWGGVYGIQLEPHKDERGCFMRVYDAKKFNEYGLHRDWVQESHSLTLELLTIRGLHFQLHPFQETKLVMPIRGVIYDVFVDLRKGSTTFGEWGSVNLIASSNQMLYIPRGFAHGFCTLTKNCEVLYKMDNYYSPKHERAIRWNDPDIGIEWLAKNPIISEKDAKAVSFKQFKEKYGGL